MRRTPKLALYAGLAGASFVAALVLGRPELVGLGAPFALVLVVGLVLPAPPLVGVRLRLERERAVEGDELEGELVLEAPASSCSLQLALGLPEGLRLVEDSPRMLLRLSAGRERRLTLRVEAVRWGIHRLGETTVRVSDLAGLRSRDLRIVQETVVRVYPRPERLQALIRPLETQPFAGNRVARAKGEGIEFADVRPYEPGDRVRRINWRQSAVRQTLHVNQQHPERNADVILFLDSFVDVHGGSDGTFAAGEGTLDLGVRAAASLAEHYLATRDRVGLISFGGMMRWLTPAGGTMQLYRIVEALLQTEIVFSYVWRGIEVLPARSLTPQALVIAISPLLDERGVHALLDLRARGFDTVLVDVSPVAFDERPGSQDELVWRLWRLWREALRYRYERLGVAAVTWDGRRPLAAAVEEVTAFRRFARTAFA